ncbi:nuclear protein [Penicillium lagena]|uniref:nuclear protein n=1 Tax=Penicillium lagena TaxID=94218 RepID=UPI0025417D2A|nr:nuclear protein [Penicillium lagena]KAJ5619326.1 nuclear protein [Penicillium lagena]
MLTVILTDSSVPWLPSEAQRQGIKKQQAIFSLDFETWQELVAEFEIEECIIPHREETGAETNQTWSG